MFQRLPISFSRRVLVPACAGLMLAVAGCSDSSPTDPSAGPVSFTTVVQQSYSGFTAPQQEVIRDSERFSAVWRQVYARVQPVPPQPSIDFSRRMVVLAAMGERPSGCYQTTVESIRGGGGLLEVAVEESEPGTSCFCTQALTQPVHLVSLERSSEPSRFEVSRRTLACS